MVSVMSLVWSQQWLCIMGSVESLGQPPAGVGEEMVDGDVGDALLVGGLAVLVAEDGGGAEDFVGEVELALFDEGEDGDGGDGLGDGGDAEEAESCWAWTRCWRSAMPTAWS